MALPTLTSPNGQTSGNPALACQENAGGDKSTDNATCDGDGLNAEQVDPQHTLPYDLWVEVAHRLDRDDVFWFAACCRTFRDAVRHCKRPLVTAISSLGASLSRSQWCLDNNFKWWSVGLRQNLFRFACKQGNLAVLKWALRNNCKEQGELSLLLASGGHWEAIRQVRPIHHDVATRAAGAGKLDMIIWMMQRGIPIDLYSVLCAAASSSHYDIVSWFMSRPNFRMRQRQQWHFLQCICYSAARDGQLDLLRTVLAEKCCSKGGPYLGALAGGRMEVLRWGEEQQYPVPDLTQVVPTTLFLPSSVQKVSTGNNIQVLDWVRVHGYKFTRRDILAAVRDNRVEVVKWILGHHPELLSEAVDMVYRFCHLELFEWLHATYRQASFYGQVTPSNDFDHIERFLEFGGSLSITALNEAAKHGHLRTLQRAHSLEGNRKIATHHLMNTADEAAKHGHVHILEWMREANVCALDTHRLATFAAKASQVAVLEWMTALLAPEDLTFSPTLLVEAVAGPRPIEMLEWLTQRGIEAKEERVTEAAVRCGASLDVLDWLWTNEFPFKKDMVSPVLSSGQLHVLTWMYGRGLLTIPALNHLIMLCAKGPNPVGSHCYCLVDMDIADWLERTIEGLEVEYRVLEEEEEDEDDEEEELGVEEGVEEGRSGGGRTSGGTCDFSAGGQTSKGSFSGGGQVSGGAFNFSGGGPFSDGMQKSRGLLSGDGQGEGEEEKRDGGDHVLLKLVRYVPRCE